MNFIESYQQNLNKTRLLSKIASFLIAVIFLIEFFTNAYHFLISTNFGWTEPGRDLLTILIFQLVISLIFVTRFILFYLKKPKSIWTLQTVWFIGCIFIFAYLSIILGVPWKKSESTINVQYLLSVHQSFLVLIPFFYLYLSPIHQFLHLIFAFFHRK